MTPDAITAPKELVAGIERSKQIFSENQNDYVSLIQKFSQVLGETFKYDSNNKFFQTSEESEQFRKELFESLVKQSNEILIQELQAKGVKDVLFIAPTGMQGAGKGTNGDTNTELAKILTNPELDETVDFFDITNEAREKRKESFKKLSQDNDPVALRAMTFARALEVKTGTGGIFFHADRLEDCKTDAEKEYFELFHSCKSALGASGGVFIESNIVAICVNLYLAHKINQSQEGISTFNIDLYPRSKDQSVLLTELQEQLKQSSITSDHKVVDFKILPEDDINFLKANKKSVVDLMSNIKDEIKDFYASIQKDYKAEPKKFTYPVLKALLQQFFSDSSLMKHYSSNAHIDSRIVKTMLDESLVAVERAKGRYEEGREDDAPLLLIKRITDYFLKSYSNAFEAPDNSLIMVSTLGDPFEVTKRAFCALYGLPENSDEISKPNGKYLPALEKYKELVARKVRGIFKYNRYNGCFVRDREVNGSFFRETINWSEDKKAVFITYEAVGSNKAITLKVTETNIQWANGMSQESNTKVWEELTRMGVTKNWNYAVKNLEQFKNHFKELSSSIRI